MWKPGQIISFESTKDGERIKYRVKRIESNQDWNTQIAIRSLMSIYRRLLPKVRANLSKEDYLLPIT